MAGFYYRDKAEITPVTKDPGTGAITRGVSFSIGCMIEDETTMLKKGTGRPVQSDIYYFAPPGTSVKVGDIIKPIERFGLPVSEPERTVLQASPYGDYKESHREVYA